MMKFNYRGNVETEMESMTTSEIRDSWIIAVEAVDWVALKADADAMTRNCGKASLPEGFLFDFLNLRCAGINRSAVYSLLLRSATVRMTPELRADR